MATPDSAREGRCLHGNFFYTAVCSAVLYSAGPITVHGAVITASIGNYKV